MLFDSDFELQVQKSYLMNQFNFQKSIESIVLEYYEHGDSEEAALSLEELNILTKKHLVSACTRKKF